jgi:hypothetical protein
MVLLAGMVHAERRDGGDHHLSNAHKPESASSTFLLGVSFENVDFVRTGNLANYTSLTQRIAFRVLPTTLENLDTHENLLSGPEAFFAIRQSALEADDGAGSTRYCLDMLREFALHRNTGAVMKMFLNVVHVTGPNFDVETFDSCELDLP